MMKIMCCIVSVLCADIGASVVLEKIKDETIICDYLIVCPEEMSSAAVNLAEHRNAFAGDDVNNAHVVYLEDIIIEFSGTDFKKRDKTLNRALSWAAQNWKDSLKYLVLMGDDAFKIDTLDSVAYSIGKMPTWYKDSKADIRYEEFDASDDYYGLILYNDTTVSILYDSVYNLRIGRIPAPTPLLADNYVEKVKQYDLYRGNRSWKNNIIAIADDNYQKDLLDPISSMIPHQTTSGFVTDLCKGFFIKKLYTSLFPTDNFNIKPAAKKAIIQQINRGAGITLYYGHGHASRLSDEEILTYSDFDRFENDSMPTVFFSFSCSNGNFMSKKEDPMCKRYLLKEQGGCIAYFASREPSYAFSNEKFGMSIFRKIQKNPDISLGQIVLESKKEVSNYANSTYYFLGDPALRCFSKTLPLNCTLLPDTVSPSAIRVGLNASEMSATESNYYVEFSFVDSVVPVAPKDTKFGRDSVFTTASGVFQNTIDISVPSIEKSPVKAVIFVWNEQGDGRAEFQIGGPGNSPVILAGSKISGRVMDITIQNNILSIVNPAKSGNKHGMLKIFDLKGRLVTNLNMAHEQSSINLSRFIKTSGKYLAMYRNGETQIRKTFMVMK